MITRSTILADMVLSNVEFLMDENAEYRLEPYKNGRENGWSLFCRKTNRRVAFSEHRSSDNIVVYCGLDNDFDMSGNIPNEYVYDQSEHYPYFEANKAAQRIIEFLDRAKRD